MAGFFDKVADTINSTANNLGDKAKELSEITALKGQIRSQEKIIESMYLEIGKLYFEAHKDEADAPYAAQMQNIVSAKIEAAKLQDSVDQIRAAEKR